MFQHLNLQNPINWSHPLNVGRVSWWLMPRNSGYLPAPCTGSTSTAPVLRDLCRRNDGIVTNRSSTAPFLSEMPNGDPCLKWGTGGSSDGRVVLGGASAFSFSNNFTVGCTFVTDTTSPTGASNLAGLLSKYETFASFGWVLRQNQDTIEFGGSTTIQSGSILATATVYRVVAVCRNGTGYIYLNNKIVASGAIAITAGTDSVMMGDSYIPDGQCWLGRIGDAFISARPWSDGDVLMDFEMSSRGYRCDNSPLRWVTSPNRLRLNALATPNFTTSVGVSSYLINASPAQFVTSINADADAGGIGPTTPSGTPNFTTNVGVAPAFQGGIPTLVSFNTNVGVAQVLQAGQPVNFTTGVKVKQSITSIANGDKRILAQKIYKR